MTIQTNHEHTHPSFPQEGFVRIKQILGDAKATPPIPAFIPISKSSWWNWVKSGKAPQPIKLGEKTTAWDARAVRQLLNDLSNTNQSTNS